MRFSMCLVLVAATLALGTGAAFAWSNVSNCVGCHTTLDPVSTSGELHTAHNDFINDCGWCHPNSGNMKTNSSELDSNNGCSGCHSAGGLRPIHAGSTAESCGCHSGDPTGAESDIPPYYGTAATTYGESRSCWDELDNDGDGDKDKGDTDCANVPTEWKSWSALKEHFGD